MPKPHPKKPHQKGVGVKLVGATESLTDLIIKDKKDNSWAKEQVANEGPEHKQVLNALLLNSFDDLVKAIEKKTGKSFKLQPGETLVSTKHEEEVTIPVPLPLQKAYIAHKADIVETAAKAPEHESLVYAMLLQVSTWGCDVLGSDN